MTTKLKPKPEMESIRNSWNVIDPGRFLVLVDFRKMEEEFGYMLRHYWIPATELTYRITTEQQQKNQSVIAEKTVTHMMGRCNADDCGWREQIVQSDGNWPELIQPSKWWTKNEFCFYDRSEQTYRRHPLLSFERWPNDGRDAMNQAFLCQPILAPLLPIPIGFQWHVRNEEGYLEYTLEATNTYAGMLVLTIRRKGEIFLNHYYQHKDEYPHEYRIRREGITLFAVNRSIVLEDRTHDIFDSKTGSPDIDGLETWSLRRLMKSALLPPAPK